MDSEIEAWKKKQAKQERIKKIACELLEQCASEGLSYLDVKQICRLVIMDAKRQAFIRPHEAKS